MKDKIPNLDEFKAWAKSHRDDALAVCMAQAFAQFEKERVAKYITPIFDSYKFQYCGELATKCKKSGPIPTRDDLYLCDDEDYLAKYYAECVRAHRAHGFTGPDGNCPALTAEHNSMLAENGFMETALDMFGLDHIPFKLEHRDQLLKLLLGACLIDERKAAA